MKATKFIKFQLKFKNQPTISNLSVEEVFTLIGLYEIWAVENSIDLDIIELSIPYERIREVASEIKALGIDVGQLYKTINFTRVGN